MTQPPTTPTTPTPEELTLTLNAALSINEVTLEEAKNLIRQGLNVNHPDPRPQFEHQTPLSVAIIHNAKPEIIDLLLSEGANPDAKDALGGTPLMLAAMTAHNHVVLVSLLQAGANPNHSDDVGWTALMYAAEKPGNLTAVKALLNAGAHHELRSPAGDTALSVAAKHSTPDVVGVLLEAGAKPGQPDHQGKTAVDYALQNRLLAGSPELAALQNQVRGGRTPKNAA